MGWLEDQEREQAFLANARKMQKTAKEGASPVVEPPVLDLSEMTKPQLIEACERRGLATIGNKADLIERLETI